MNLLQHGEILEAEPWRHQDPQPDEDMPWEIAAQIADSMSQFEASEPEEVAIMPEALLDLTGVTSHRSFDAVEKERWERGQEMSRKLAEVGQLELAKKLSGCHQQKSVAVCCGCSKRTMFWNRCDVFWCPQCSPRLSKRRLDGLMFFVEKMRQPKHLVLTFRNVETLTELYVKSCVRALQRFRRRKLFARVRSGLWAMEITNKGTGWHVHFHLVIDSPWMDVRAISATWEKVTECGSSVVWIEDASRGGLRANLPRYVTKYAGKGFEPHTWDAGALGEFAIAIESVRTFGVFGELLGARKEWAAWLRSVRESRRKCECGSCEKKFYSELSLQWHDHGPPPCNMKPLREIRLEGIQWKWKFD